MALTSCFISSAMVCFLHHGDAVYTTPTPAVPQSNLLISYLLSRSQIFCHSFKDVLLDFQEQILPPLYEGLPGALCFYVMPSIIIDNHASI